MTYKLTQGWPQNTQTGAFVDPETNDVYLMWLVNGGVPLPVDTVVVNTPSSVTMRQARLALLQTGYLSSVQVAIDQIPDAAFKQASQIEWDYAATVDRNSPFTQGMAVSLGLTEEDMDNLFTLAASL